MSALVEELGPALEDVLREGFHHVGHSTHWIVLENVHILTDPWLSEPASFCLAHRPKPSSFPRNPHIVLITHEHTDHFDCEALKQITREASIVVPLKWMAEKVIELGFKDVHFVSPGQTLSLRGLKIEAVLGKHDVYEICYRVEGKNSAFFFGGDTMVTPELREFAKRKPVSLAILPGERSSLLGKQFVMSPPEAVALAREFDAKAAVLSHHESFVSKLFPIGWAVRLPPVKKEEFPDWFVIPNPGDYVPFPSKVSNWGTL